MWRCSDCVSSFCVSTQVHNNETEQAEPRYLIQIHSNESALKVGKPSFTSPHLSKTQTHSPICAHAHSHAVICLFLLLSLSPLHNQAWFPPHRKTSLFPHCLRLSAILCGPLLNSAHGQKYPHMAPLNGTGHTDHRHTALKIQRSSATAPLVHSLALTRLGNRQRERKKKPGPRRRLWKRRWCNADTSPTVGVEKHACHETTSDLERHINAFRYQPADKNFFWRPLNIQRWWWRGRNSLEVIKLSQLSDWLPSGRLFQITIVSFHSATLYLPDLIIQRARQKVRESVFNCSCIV